MKKALRIVLICVGVIVLLVVAVLILAFQPSVQTWAARKAVAGGAPAGMEISIGRVAAGLNRTEVTGIHVTLPGMTLDLPSATVDVSLMGLLRSRVDVKNLVAKGWTVDLSQPAPVVSSTTATTATAQPATASAKQEPFSGVFDLVKLPVDLTVASVDVSGTIILPPQEAGAQPARATVAVLGGQLAPGSDAKFDITGDANMPGANAPVSSVKVQGALTARMDTPRTFQAIGFDAEANATGAQFPQGARIHAQVAAQRGAGAAGESYTVMLKSTDAAGAGAEKNLVNLQAANPTGGKGLDATWAVDLRDADLAPFIVGLGLKLPEFAVNGQGMVSADSEFQTIHATGKLNADVNKLETLRAELGTLGRMSFAANFDVVREGDVVRVSALNADVSSNSMPVASVKTLQIIEANTATGALKVPDLNADLVRVDIAGVPLDWAQPFIKDTGFAITGGPLRGSLTGKASNGGFSLRSVAPMTFASLSVAQQQPNQPPAQLVRNVDVSANFTADYTPAGLNATISGLSLQSGGATLLTLDAKAASPAAQAGKPAPAISATGTLRANLAALMAQPAAADFKVLSSGSADVDFTAQVAPDVQQVAAKLVLSNLHASDKTATAMPSVTADLRADVRSNGEIAVQAPFVFELNSRKSDINLTATLRPDGARQNIDATIQGNEIYVEDMKTFAALAPASTSAPAATPAPATPSAPAKPDTKAAWDAFTGQVKLDIKKVIYSPDMQVGSLTGSIKITPSLLSLESFHAATNDGAEAKISGTVKFDNTGPSAAQPYDTAVNLDVTNFDPAPILKAANPNQRPTVEGKFDITGAVTGKSETLPALANTAAADLTLTSRGGKFNGFATSSGGSTLSAVQKIASSAAGSNIVGGLLSMVGGKVGEDATAAVAKAKAASNMLGRLVEINFDQMNIDASYHPGKETVIKNFSILSPDMRLTSNGTVGHDSTLTWAKQTIKLVASMSVRGDQANDMRALGLLKADADSLGFTPLVDSFPIEGTASSLTTDALVKQLVSRVPGLGALK